MKRIIFNVRGLINAHSRFILSGVIMLLFVFLGQGVNAQSLASGGVVSPKSEVGSIANGLGITVYAFNSWDLARVKSVLKTKFDQTGTGTSLDRFKRAYYEMVNTEMSYDVAPQLSTIKMLSLVKQKVNDPSITDAVLRSIYNDLISSF